MPVNMEQVRQRVYPSARQVSHWILRNAGVVELVDTMDSKSIERKLVPVQVRLSVPILRVIELANSISPGGASYARRAPCEARNKLELMPGLA